MGTFVGSYLWGLLGEPSWGALEREPWSLLRPWRGTLGGLRSLGTADGPACNVQPWKGTLGALGVLRVPWREKPWEPWDALEPWGALGVLGVPSRKKTAS